MSMREASPPAVRRWKSEFSPVDDTPPSTAPPPPNGLTAAAHSHFSDHRIRTLAAATAHRDNQPAAVTPRHRAPRHQTAAIVPTTVRLDNQTNPPAVSSTDVDLAYL